MVKGSSLLLPGGLGPPVQILPQKMQLPHPSCAFTSRSTSSYFYSCRPVHQHSSLRTSRQQVLFLDIKSQNRNISRKDFRSSFYGDAGALKKQKPWPEKKVKEVGKLFPIKITPIRRPKQFRVVQSSSRPFNESHRPRGSFPSLGTQTSTAPEPKFPTANSDQNKTRYFNSPGSLDPIGSSSPLDYVQPVLKAKFHPKEVSKGSISSEQRRSCLKEESTYEQRAPNPNSSWRSGVKFEPSYVLAEKSVPGSSKTIVSSNQSPYSGDQWESRVEQDYIGGHQTVRRGPDSGACLLSYSQATPMSLEKIESGVKSAVMVPDQFRNSQNGAHPAPHNYRIPSASGKQRYDRSVIRQAPSSAVDAFRYQWWLQRMGAEAQSRREAEQPLESRYRRELDASLGYQGARRQGNNSVAQLEASLSSERGYSREPEPFLGYQGARGQGNSIVAQLEAPPPRARVEGAGKWREAAKIYEQNRNPSHRVSAIETRRQNTDSLTSELERARDISTANLNRSSTANEVMRSHEPRLLPREEEGQFADFSEGGVFENSMRQDVLPEKLDKLGAGISTANLNRSLTGNEVLRFHEPGLLPREEEGQFADISGGGVCDSSVRRDVVTEKPDKLGVGGYSQQANLSNEQDNQKQQWMNADVLVVNNAAVAEAVVEKLRGQYRDLTHACDTEVSHIDVKKESPVGHGCMICFSIYCGPKPDFGGGKCRLWVDVLGKPEVLEIFKPYFEDPNIKKVWHNYSFDKHILANHGINTQGFHADTMHLARLYDSARTVAQGGYSLEGLTSDKNLMGGHWGELKLEESGGKRSMKHIFGKPNIKKNGEEGKLRVVRPVEELQTQPEWQEKWIHYSSFDTVCTWCLWSSLKEKLGREPWLIEGKFIQEKRFMYDFYLEYVRPFGELLIQMEADGMMLDREHLAKIEAIAIEQQEFAASQFKKWAAKRCPDAIYMNVGSDAQIRQLLFGGKANKNDPDKRLEMERIFNAPNTENYIEEGRKIPKKTRPFTLRGLGVDIPVDTYTSGGWPAVGADALKDLAGKVSIDYNMLAEEEPAEDLLLEAESAEVSAVLTSTGIQGGSEEDLSLYGKAYKAFGGGREGKEACMALAALCEVSSINTLISNFIQPLQGNDIKGPDGRIHCSLNINTETGRLSARRPSLQNQPALEKDRYKIRQAFVAAPGKSLIVADYGQLELRVLAHLTDCKSMLKAFSDGGDFHSRTAMNMYAHVRNAVERGDVILEWEPKPGEKKPPVPLLKDVFGAERRKAKMLNFSIAYGKTAMGLSKDWKVSLDEAKATVKLWYSDRQEVSRWQEERIKEATKTHHVHTLLGRTRHFPDVTSSSPLIRGHIERAAINTPVQGSAADVAMCAMLQISRNKTLQDLGWRLLLQVHDEVILEGPSESAAVAKDVVVNCMGFPFGGKNILRVALAVDANFAQNWYAAK